VPHRFLAVGELFRTNAWTSRADGSGSSHLRAIAGWQLRTHNGASEQHARTVAFQSAPVLHMYYSAHAGAAMQADYSHWTDQELKHAEVTADQFLRDNATQIIETLKAKLNFLEFLIQRLDQRNASLNHRLDCFARIAEISQFIKDDAQGFFELASQPIVARLLQGVENSGEQE
jgi:hypothetical protein